MSETLIGLLHKSSSHSRPRQIAWAVVCGCVCGLMPKTSLLFPVCLFVSFLLPIHFVTAGICMLVTSCCTPLLHPLMGNLGHWMFQGERLRQWAHNLDQVPAFPWFKLHNTVVLGAVSVSIVMAWPLYWIVQQVLMRPYANWMWSEHQLQLAQLEQITQTQSADSNLLPEPIEQQRPQSVSPQVEPKPLAASLHAVEEVTANTKAPVASSLAEAIDSIHALEDLLEKVTSDTDGRVDAQAVLARATQASELVDEILQSLDAIESKGLQGTTPRDNESNAKQMVVRIDTPQTFSSHDTKISIYRRARTGETLVASSDSKTEPEKDSMPSANAPTTEQPMLAVAEPHQASNTSVRRDPAGPSSSTEVTRKGAELPHEEALRHLLNHLRALKEKV